MSSRISLAVIDVKEPCAANWSAMNGSEQAKFCSHCNKHVYNLSAMTLNEAERLVCESAGSICVRFERLEDGRVRTLDYQQVARRRIGWKGWVGISLILSTFATAGERWWTRSRSVVSPAVVGRVMVMGKIAPRSTTCPTAQSSSDQGQEKIPPESDGI